MSKILNKTNKKLSMSDELRHVQPGKRLLKLAKFLESDGNISGSDTTKYCSDIDLLFSTNYLQSKSGEPNYENIMAAFIMFKTMKYTPCAVKKFLNKYLIFASIGENTNVAEFDVYFKKLLTGQGDGIISNEDIYELFSKFDFSDEQIFVRFCLNMHDQKHTNEKVTHRITDSALRMLLQFSEPVWKPGK